MHGLLMRWMHDIFFDFLERAVSLHVKQTATGFDTHQEVLCLEMVQAPD